MRHSDRWPHGAVVSKVLGGPGGTVITGKVLVLHRLRDDAPFRKVRIDGPGDDRIGRDVWPDGWVLGVGQFDRTCLECRQSFRSSQGDTDFCQLCDRSTTSQHAITRGQARADLRGTATKTLKPRPRTSPAEEAQRSQEIAEIKAQDEQESPY